MRFCDKLSNLRRQNNITQEQLADRLEISRQAVSKWESGTSIPDISKMMELCNILNCTLEDLLDDGVIGGKTESNKTTPKNYFQDFLKYISKVYNMFCSMKFKDILKCLFEMLIIIGILFISGLIISSIIEEFLFEVFGLIPNVGHYIANFLNNIVVIGLIILALIIFFHLFKIRYLDYYEIIEDKNISEKVIEKPIDEKEEYKVPKKEKIIIRDPKHSTFSFFEFLSKILIFILKLLSIFALAFLVMFFAGFLIVFFISLWHALNGIIFIYLAIAILGILCFIYTFLEVFYFFITSTKEHFKRIFIIGIIGLILFGLGTGFSIATYLNYPNYDISLDGIIKEKSYEMQDDLAFAIFEDYYDLKYNYVIDDNLDNIIVEVKSIGNFEFHLHPFKYDYQSNEKYTVLRPHFNRNAKDIYDLLIKSIKEKKSLIGIFDMNDSDLYQITIKVSNENYQKLKENSENYNKHEDYFYATLE